MSTATPKPRRSLRRRLAFSAIIGLLFVLLLELGFRLLWDRPPTTLGAAFITSGVFVPDANSGWRMKPDLAFDHELHGNPTTTFHTDARGLRTPARQALPDRQTVVFLGDSFTFGWGVEDAECFAWRVDARLEGADAVNLGVSGYNIAMSHRLLVAEGLPLKPDVVVLVVCMNDVTKQIIPDMLQIQANARAHRAKWKGIKAAICDHSYLAGFLQHSASTIRPIRRTLQSIGLKDPDGGYEYLDENVRPFLKEYPPSLQDEWEDFVREIGAVQETCRTAGARLLVVYMPPRQAVVPGSLERALAYVKFAPADFEMQKPVDALLVACEKIGASFLDLSPALEAPDDRYFLHFDMHINARGHAAVAAALLPRIRSLLAR